MNIHDIQKEVIRKFPIGCKFIPVGASSSIKLLEDYNTYKITVNNKSIWAHTGAGDLYKEGKWATLVSLPESKEESIPEYIECTSSKDSESYFIKGNVYKVVKASPISSAELRCNILKDYKEHNILYTRLVDTDGTKLFKPSTKEAYEAQNTYLRAAEYTPQVGDYVVMEKAGGWGYSPDNNGCVAIVSSVGKNIVVRDEVFSIWGEVINPNNNSRGVKFSDIPQFGYDKEVIFRKALPHEIPSSNVKVEPQQQGVEWSEGTYAVAVKGNFGDYKSSKNLVTIGSIFTIKADRGDRTVVVKESQFWVYKENLKWFATYDEAAQFSNRLPQFEASPTAAVSESPLEICRKKYKKGMLVRSAKKYGEHSGEFIIDVDPSEFTNTGSGVDYFASRGWLYINGKFADILEEPKEPLTRENREFHLELERKTQYPITPKEVFPVKPLKKQIKKNKFQEVHEIKIVEEKLLKKTKSKLFNI